MISAAVSASTLLRTATATSGVTFERISAAVSDGNSLIISTATSGSTLERMAYWRSVSEV